MRTVLATIFFSSIYFSLISCSKSDWPDDVEDTSHQSSQIDQTPILSVKIGTAWEVSDSVCSTSNLAYIGDQANKNQNAACDKVTTVHKTCEIPAGSKLETTVNCDVSIPEGQLFYSSIRFQLSAAKKQCAVVVFQPNYYIASNSSSFTPAWGSGNAIDCSKMIPGTQRPENAGCYNGVATTIAPKFPKYTGIYYVFGNEAGIWDLVARSANSVTPSLSNRWASNDISDSKRTCSSGTPALPTGDGYVCNSYVDYSITCLDEYEFVKYKINFRVLDVDDSGVASNLGYPTLNQDQSASWRP